MDLTVFLRGEFFFLYFILGLLGIFYGLKRKNRLLVVVAMIISSVSGLMILAAIILISGIK